MDRLSSPLLALFASVGLRSADSVARPDWKCHFDARGAPGTFVLFEPAKDRYSVFDEARAKQRFLPASTFKLADALIGLEMGSISRRERRCSRGTASPGSASPMERDHTLATGMRDNAVWMFQEVARRIGKARMREWLDRLDYGNRTSAAASISSGCRADCAISAIEQVEFLHRLAEGRLPVTHRAQRLVRDAMVVEKTRSHTLYAKSGTTGARASRWTGGWAGSRSKGRPLAYFAMNLSPHQRMRPVDCVQAGRASWPPKACCLANPRPHERLNELALEEQECDQQRRRGHQRGRGDHRPVDALVAGGEHLQAHRHRPRGRPSW